MTILDAETLDLVTGGGALARGAGEAFGFGAGVAVTSALSLSSKWSQQVPGKPDGFQQRHEAVLGPKVAAHATTMSPGLARDFVSGVGAGATAAPGWSFEHGL